MISIIVPFYNVDRYLPQCLESIINQTFKDIEILCINDCTLDNSASIVKYYQSLDNRVKMISYSNNRGLGGARNEGLKYAQGEYVMFIDSDDYIAPTMVQELYDDISNHPVDCAMCAVMNVFNNGQSYASALQNVTKTPSRIIHINPKTKVTDVWPTAPIKIYKKDIIDRYHCHFTEGKLYEDHEFFYDYFAHVSSFYYNNHPLYYYRCERVGSITTSSVGREVEIFSVLRIINDRFEELFSEDERKRQFCKVAFRLLWERQWTLQSNQKRWLEFSALAKKYLLSQYTPGFIEQNKDSFISRDDVFSKYILDSGLKGSVTMLKQNLKQYAVFRKFNDQRKKVQNHRSTRSLIKESLWVEWQVKNKLDQKESNGQRSI